MLILKIILYYIHMTSVTYFSNILKKKVSHREPLFVIPLTLDRQIKGGDESKFIYNQIMNYDELCKRFLFLMHKTFNNAILMLRQIFLIKGFDYKKLRKYITEDEQLNNYDDKNDDTALDIFNVMTKKDDSINTVIVSFPFWKCDNINNVAKSMFGTTDNNTIIIKTYNLDEDNSGFLLLWGEFIENLQGGKRYFYSIKNIRDAMELIGFEYIEELTPRTDPEKNPGFITYIVFKRHLMMKQ
jgi:hypothetical protein